MIWSTWTDVEIRIYTQFAYLIAYQHINQMEVYAATTAEKKATFITCIVMHRPRYASVCVTKYRCLSVLCSVVCCCFFFAMKSNRKVCILPLRRSFFLLLLLVFNYHARAHIQCTFAQRSLSVSMLLILLLLFFCVICVRRIFRLCSWTFSISFYKYMRMTLCMSRIVSSPWLISPLAHTGLWLFFLILILLLLSFLLLLYNSLLKELNIEHVLEVDIYFLFLILDTFFSKWLFLSFSLKTFPIFFFCLCLSIFDVIYAIIYRNSQSETEKKQHVIKNNIWIYDIVPFFNATLNGIKSEWDENISMKMKIKFVFFLLWINRKAWDSRGK